MRWRRPKHILKQLDVISQNRRMFEKWNHCYSTSCLVSLLSESSPDHLFTLKNSTWGMACEDLTFQTKFLEVSFVCQLATWSTCKPQKLRDTPQLRAVTHTMLTEIPCTLVLTSWCSWNLLQIKRNRVLPPDILTWAMFQTVMQCLEYVYFLCSNTIWKTFFF